MDTKNLLSMSLVTKALVSTKFYTGTRLCSQLEMTKCALCFGGSRLKIMLSQDMLSMYLLPLLVMHVALFCVKSRNFDRMPEI